MKLPFMKDHQTKVMPQIILVTFAMALAALLYYFKSVWAFVEQLFSLAAPFFLGFGVAYLLRPVLHGIERGFKRFIFKTEKYKKLRRILSALLSLFLLLAVVSLFLTFMLPQLIQSIESIIGYVTAFLNSNTDAVNNFLLKYDFLRIDGEQLDVAWDNIANMLLTQVNGITVLLDNLFVISKTIISTVFDLLVGLITAFYIMMDKEHIAAQIKKIGYSIMRRDRIENWIYWTRQANRIFSGFITGKVIDSCIIGVICYIGMLIFKMEYPLLICCVIGVTNIIPFFGPFIGWAPCALILLIINPMSALWFSLFILFLQQLDGNVIGPHILGDYVGVSALSIMIAIVIGGGLFGFTGMLVSVPVYALAYAIVRASITMKLKDKGLPTATEDYVNAPGNLKQTMPTAEVKDDTPAE